MTQLLRRTGGVAVVLVAIAVDLLVWGGDRQLRGGELLPVWAVPVATVLVLGTLLFRWRYPVSVFALQWLYSLAGLFVIEYEPFAGLLVALHAVSVRCSARIAVAALVACAVPIGVNSVNVASAGDEATSGARLAIFAVLWAVLYGAVWGVGRLSHGAERRADAGRVAAAEEAVRIERLRLARELHDIVAHAVSVMILQAAGARTLVDPHDEQVRGALTVIETAGVQAMQELHRLLGLLRTVDPAAADDDHATQPGLDDIAELVELSRNAGQDVTVAVDGQRVPLDRSVELAAYRVVQEAMTNVMKHVGTTATIRIHLGWGHERLTVSVRNTRGLPPPKPAGEVRLSSGHGLRGLYERVGLVGGHLQAGPVPDGFLVRAELPIGRRPANQVVQTTTEVDR